jgi:uncharacterized protein (TIGR02246 family)
MRTRTLVIAAGGVTAAIVLGMLVPRDNRSLASSQQPAGAQAEKADDADETGVEDKGRDEDREAIRESSRAFTECCHRGDARAVASLWTENGEFEDEDGTILRGRSAIEKAFREVFKEKEKHKIKVHVTSIRFPSRDCAIEEGVLRRLSSGPELPTSTLYRAFHVREGKQWRMAVAHEWGADEDHLEDLDWLLGAWKAKAGEQEVTLSLHKEKHKPYIVGTFTKKAKGKVTSAGTLKIGFDSQRGQLRSWHFDDDGGHGQSLWIRDGSRWVLDSIGALPDGTETAALNILTRLGDREITWRSIDRVVGDEELPDTAPIKLVRVPEKK